MTASKSLKAPELFRAARTAVRPPSRLSPAEWAGKFVRIQNSERAAFFDVDQTPWWRRPMDAAADNEVREIVVLAPTGSGKSTMAEALIPWIISEDPGPLLYASQTDADAKFWAESRLIPSLKTCQPLKSLWPEDRHKSRKMEIIFPHMPMVLGGANLSNFQEKSVRWLYGDEVWEWKPGLVREFLARHHNRWNRRVFLVSQGGVVGDELWQEWEKTDKAEFCWTCPKCENVQPYLGQQLVVDVQTVDGEMDIQATADTARLRCPVCEHEITDTVANRRDLASSGIYVPQASGLKGYIGCHVHALAVWWVPWSEYAIERIQAQNQLQSGIFTKLRQLTQKRDASPWREDMADAKRELTSSGYTLAEYEAGNKIENEKMRFLTVDVGREHYWAVIRAWKDGGDSMLIWAGYVETDEKLRQLQQSFGVDDRHVFIDTGYDSARIYDLCAFYGWTGIRGDQAKGFQHKRSNGRAVEKLFSRIKRTRAPSGGVALWVMISADGCKNVLARLRNGEGARWDVPADVSDSYKHQIDSEARRTFVHSKTGQESHKWVKIRRANHLWDCENYQVAAALIAGLFTGTD